MLGPKTVGTMIRETISMHKGVTLLAGEVFDTTNKAHLRQLPTSVDYANVRPERRS